MRDSATASERVSLRQHRANDKTKQKIQGQKKESENGLLCSSYGERINFGCVFCCEKRSGGCGEDWPLPHLKRFASKRTSWETALSNT